MLPNDFQLQNLANATSGELGTAWYANWFMGVPGLIKPVVSAQEKFDRSDIVTNVKP